MLKMEEKKSRTILKFPIFVALLYTYSFISDFRVKPCLEENFLS